MKVMIVLLLPLIFVVFTGCATTDGAAQRKHAHSIGEFEVEESSSRETVKPPKEDKP